MKRFFKWLAKHPRQRAAHAQVESSIFPSAARPR
jgi:hypothetical protein